MIKKLFFKAETGPLAFLIAGAFTCGGIHLTKLALDPHNKSVDDRKLEDKKYECMFIQKINGKK